MKGFISICASCSATSCRGCDALQGPPHSVTEALVQALVPCLIAPTDADAQEPLELAQSFAAGCTSHEIETCKSLAQRMTGMAGDVQ